MTIRDAIARFDMQTHNTYTDSEKIEWLSRLDAKVWEEIIATHEGAPTVEFHGYDDSTSMETELLIPGNHEEVYLRWLEAQVAYHNGESAAYNAAGIMFNGAYEGFAAWYNRTHMPLSQGARFLF